MSEDLKWIAENRDEWPGDAKSCDVVGGAVNWRSDKRGSITRAQWQAMRDELNLNRTPEPTEKVWRGPEDGLPPVGLTVLNWTNEKCTVIAHDNGNIVCRIEESHGGYRGYTPEQVKTKLKPLRSEEDKAVEEMMQILRHKSWSMENDEIPEIVRDLYRAGLRFTEETK